MEPTDTVYEITRHYVADVADALGPEITSTVLGYLRSRSISSLASVSSLYSPVLHGCSVLKALLQIEAFFKKCDVFSNENCSEVAYAGFLESEEICRATNERLDGFYDLPESEWLRQKVERMESIIDSVLGPRHAFIEVLPSLIRVTNGATAAHPRSKSGGAARLKRTMYATERSHAYLRALAKFWGYSINFRKIHHNRVELVPKNWKTHRTIACEPEGNIALQLAFDTYCKRKLRSRLNIDLSDQSRNQRLALESSVHGKLCTVDLKAASDRLSLNVVHLLFQREWVDFFLDTRSPYWKDKSGALVPYSKLSSMGNGYTFTVETLIFAAACKALGSRAYSVYGDDIIIETELFGQLVQLLTYLGFEINQEKSHVEIPRKRETDVGNTLACIRDDVEGPQDSEYLRDTRNTAELRVYPGEHGGGAGLSESLDRGTASWLYSYGNRPSGQEHSHDHGTYRESCGVHAFGGLVITPFFIRSLRTRRDWVLLINNIMSFGTPGGTLWEFAISIVRKLNLPLGPPVLDTCTCVFIDVSTCYRLGLIRFNKAFGPWQPAFRGLVERSREVTCYDSRSLFLWFLHRKGRPYESSRHTLGTYKCRTKWMRYRPAMADIMGGTVRLYWWTELLAGREAC